MRIHYLQHESFEDLESIYQWANKPENTITSTRFFEPEFILPVPSEIDLLIIMGGPMGVYDEEKYPWLIEEKKFIRKSIDAGVKILGICLGSQLLAEVLGGKVYKHTEREIGWWDVEFLEAAKDDYFFQDFPSKAKMFHWHGDTFDLPEGANWVAKSSCCRHQAFTYKNQIAALQFHPEATEKLVNELIHHCSDELTEGKYIQSKKDLQEDTKHLPTMNELLIKLLEKMRGD